MYVQCFSYENYLLDCVEEPKGRNEIILRISDTIVLRNAQKKSIDRSIALTLKYFYNAALQNILFIHKKHNNTLPVFRYIAAYVLFHLCSSAWKTFAMVTVYYINIPRFVL